MRNGCLGILPIIPPTTCENSFVIVSLHQRILTEIPIVWIVLGFPYQQANPTYKRTTLAFSYKNDDVLSFWINDYDKKNNEMRKTHKSPELEYIGIVTLE